MGEAARGLIQASSTHGGEIFQILNQDPIKKCQGCPAVVAIFLASLASTVKTFFFIVFASRFGLIQTKTVKS